MADDISKKNNPLAQFLEDMNINQTKMADLFGVNHDKIFRRQSGKMSLDLDFLLNLSKFSGLSIDRLVNNIMTFPVMENPGILREENIKLSLKLDKAIDCLKENNILVSDNNEKLDDIISIKQIIKELKTIKNINLQKPVISLMGKINSGKSSFINFLTGTKKMPVDYKALTSIAVLIKHKKDRPVFIKSEVVIFKDVYDFSWLSNITGAEDEDYKKYFVEEGDSSLLEKYGTFHNFHNEKITCGIIYIDSPILENIDIIDMPGFDNINLNEKNKFYDIPSDVVIFLSRIDDFIDSSDMICLKILMKKISQENILITASHGSFLWDGSKEKTIDDRIDNLFNNAAVKFNINENEKIEKQFYVSETSYCDGESLPNGEIIDLKKYRDKFNKDFSNLIKNINKIKIENNKNNILDYIKLKLKEIEDIENIENSKNLTSNLNCEKIKELEKEKKIIISLVEENKKLSINEFEQYYKELFDQFNLDKLVSLIKSKNIKKQKVSLESFSSILNEELELQMNSILEEKMNHIPENILKLKLDKKALILPVGIAAGAGALVGSHVGIAGVAGALVGGSIAFPIGLAVAAVTGIGAFGTLAGTWERDFAKKLCSYYDKNKILDIYKNRIENYWNNYLNNTIIDIDNKIKSIKLSDSIFNVSKQIEIDIESLSDELNDISYIKTNQLKEYLKEIKNIVN